ncbi:hypothetical protein [Dactylosporangium sp. NPDC048998]|uniref:hypothetical protein n=1 Tax=Dactylosporangium sp. NPDC048998 TaxID=3363976 RepID=UPI00370F935E
MLSTPTGSNQTELAANLWHIAHDHPGLVTDTAFLEQARPERAARASAEVAGALAVAGVNVRDERAARWITDLSQLPPK